ncbi:MAG: chemotaxis protein CheB [Bdellovibrionota bacterium]
MESPPDDALPPESPDFVEQDYLDSNEQLVPSHSHQKMPMVAIGGSAGSIAALNELFKKLPPDTGMVFVVIIHLSPDYESKLTEILGRCTSMTVVQAEDGAKAEPNCVYVIPPGKYLTTFDGRFKLSEILSEKGRRVAVDVFFRSLADSHGSQAIAVILSGMDGDGTLGIKRVKERGGLTIAQDPSEAAYPGMPRSSIDTGMVDRIVAVDQLAERLVEYISIRNRLKLPPEDGQQPASSSIGSMQDDREIALRELLLFLRLRTGRDFSYYKRATIVRRISRRMQVNGIEDLPSYLAFVRTHPGESGALLQDLLISVTNFFRDRDVFEALASHLPELFRNKPQSDSVRIWVPACATGEEAYSIAILLLEYARGLDAAPALQVFACDLDEEAIQVARAGQYPEAITADVSEERLRKFFIKEHQGYRVRRELREMVLFASHDLLKDAPFSRMDLISCRNLLIYLNQEAQHRVLETFHFALKPLGLILLGASESVDDGSTLFRTIDKKRRIYAPQSTIRASSQLPFGATSLLRAIEAQGSAEKNAPVVHGRRFSHDAQSGFHEKLGRNLDRSALIELHSRLIERYGPPSVLVNAEYEIMHLSEQAGAFLKFTGGEPTVNLLRVVNPSLRIELRTALFRATESGTPIETLNLLADVEGKPCEVDILVAPAKEIAPGFLVVTFARQFIEHERQVGEERAVSEQAARQIERELEQVKTDLRDTVEQYEAANEELKASNEELQAMNEELRSATEELETSREELQSINEELTTVNQEMKIKVDELANANSDLQNLMASTSIATVFLDRDLAIKRFTPWASSLFNLIPSDVGRSLAHLKPALDYQELLNDAEAVLRTLVPIERQVKDAEHCYLARIQPYRTPEDLIAGTVLTLIDVTERNSAMEALQRAEERMRLVFESAKDFAIFTTDRDRRVNYWNRGAETVFGYAESEIIGKSADILFTHQDLAKGDADREVCTAARDGRAENERWHARKDGSLFYGSGSVMPLRDAAGEVCGFVKIMRDLTESKRVQDALREQMDELKRFNVAAVGREGRMIELKNEINELCARLKEPRRYALESN